MMLTVTLGQGFLLGILGLGIFMTYRILNFPDMTAEGSFPLGGAVTVTLLTHQVSPILATIAGMLAGIFGGLVTGLLYTKGKIPVVLSGILVMTGLNSVMLYVMKRSNLTLLNQKRLNDYVTFSWLRALRYVNYRNRNMCVVSCGFNLFLHTSLGQSYIATGDNEVMARSLGISTDRMKLLGLSVSNGIIALSGSLVAQNDGNADINKGIGIIVIGLSSIIIGEVLFGELLLLERLIAIVVGSVVYQLLILVVIKLGVDTSYLKIFSSLILAGCLILPRLKGQMKMPKKERVS